MTDVAFAAAAQFDRNLFWHGGNSIRHMVVRLKASRGDSRRDSMRTPLNIALAIDASGSMAGGKLEAAKRAALGLAERLTDRDRLSVVSFSSDIQVHLDAVPAAADNAARIRAEIARLQTRGMTCLSGGWFAAVDCAARLAEERPEMTPRVIILSDGHANEGIVDPAQLSEHAGKLRLRGVLTSALGIGDGYDEQLLRGIAENGGGRLHDAELDGEISSVLLGELDDILGTAVEDARIVLTAPPGVRVEVFGRGQTEAPGGQIVVPMGSIQHDVERVAVFKVKCPAAEQSETLSFGVTADGRAVDDGARLEAGTAVLSLVAVNGTTNSAQARDLGTAMVVARTWSAHLVATASKMNRDRDFARARSRLERELERFRRYVDGLEGGHVMVRELEMLAQRVDQEFSPRMQKEMVIQASLAMESRVDRRGAGKAAWSDRMERGD
jgi:Ca-activated chloride channel family protein